MINIKPNTLITLLSLLFAQSIYAQDVADSNYAFNKGAEYFKQYNFKDAVYWFGYSIDNGYNIAISSTYKGGAEVLMGDYQAAKKDLDRAFAIDSTIPDLYFYRGMQFNLERNYDSAIFFFKRAIALNPLDANSYDFLGQTFMAKKNYDTAFINVRKAIALQRNNPKFINDLGCLELNTGDYKTAYFHFKSILNVNTVNDPLLQSNLAACEWKLNKNYKLALEKCDNVLTKYPDLLATRVLRGQIYIDIGEKDKGCVEFKILTTQKGNEQAGMENLKKFECP